MPGGVQTGLLPAVRARPRLRREWQRRGPPPAVRRAHALPVARGRVHDRPRSRGRRRQPRPGREDALHQEAEQTALFEPGRVPPRGRRQAEEAGLERHRQELAREVRQPKKTEMS